MDGTADDDLAGELLDLTRQLRSRLLHHATLGAWAAPGGASARPDAVADVAAGAAEPAAATEPGAPSREDEAVEAWPDAARAAARSTRTDEPDGDAAPERMEEPELRERPELRDPIGAIGAIGDAAAAGQRGVAAPPDAMPVGRAPIALGRRTLAEVRAELGDCTRCKLHSTRHSIVFGVGAPDTPLMFVGEAPGEQEDRRGEPFVGPAGQLLDKMIEAMGWTRGTVYIANTTKCRPPGNRNPQPDELSQCMPFLDQQIAAIAPRIIVALGRPAANQLLGIDAPISSLRGRFHDHARGGDRVSLKIMPTFHPAYLLRDPDKKRLAWADLKLVMAELARLGIAAPEPARG
jgi:DNA polymerase